MQYGYSSNRNIQMLISLLKEYNIRKVIASPGSTALNFVASVQQDDIFELYSEVDERNATYMACGLAAESGEPVVITCTGATASRDYLPGLSEAYYRKLPILAVTGTQDVMNTGNLSPQYIDRSQAPKDAVKYSVHLQTIKDQNDEWDCNLKLNRAISELFRHGGGPVHINLTTEYGNDGFGVDELPQTRVIRRYEQKDQLPELPNAGRIAITVGGHKPWTTELTEAVDAFCAAHDAAVFVDHSSGYHGKYRVMPTLVAAQEYISTDIFSIDLLIHIGEQSGDYYTYGRLFAAKEVWRVSEDGEMRDTFHKLTKVFEMPEEHFFHHYAKNVSAKESPYLKECKDLVDSLYTKIPELPFSNIWLTQYLSRRLPTESTLHLGVSNTMRSWNFFETSCQLVWPNVGCRGIDGVLPTAVGMSFATPDRIHYCVLGDLTFFYGLNALGNRQIRRNLRVLLINNGGGAEFRLYQHKAQRTFGDDSSPYIAAAGHFGNKSATLVKNFSEALGFEYLTASSKEEFSKNAERFLSPELTDRPIIFEVFTDAKNESLALKTICTLIERPEKTAKEIAKDAVKGILGDTGVKTVKHILGRN